MDGQQKATRSLDRLRPRLAQAFSDWQGSPEWTAFSQRLERYFPPLFERLVQLYGDQYDFFYHLEQILIMTGRLWLERPAPLQALDAQREARPDWLQDQAMVGGVCYVDRFATNLAGLREKIPYFKELGLTYLHLMPLYLAPETENDGGYAVSDYRQVDPQLGQVAELTQLAVELRANGISLVLDFVFNHTSDEHRWAQAALAGDGAHQDYYFIFPDRTLPDQYDAHLREIFPDVRRGSFSYRPEIESWVWTTFNNFQWDLNYRNPEVFREMAQEMLQLANLGVEILRLDALAFTWKEMGTTCESRPEAHILVQAFNLVARMAAPALLFKSEAIVHPDEVIEYIGQGECQISYNPLLMSLLWESLATRQSRLLTQSLSHRFALPEGAAWVNYVRCHDDIGWTFDDGDAGQLNINGYDHRRFLNAFYTGRFPGSFARGLPFQENPRTGDARISGSLASLAGLEAALQKEGNESEIDLAIRRILLLHGIILSIGGIPLLYLNDEIGVLNDYTYRGNPAHAHDSRWVHRPLTDWAQMGRRQDPTTAEGCIFQGLAHLIALRKAHPVFAGSRMQVAPLDNGHLFAYVRANQGQRLLVVANFSERPQPMDPNELRLRGLSHQFVDLISGRRVRQGVILVLEPYQLMWLLAD